MKKILYFISLFLLILTFASCDGECRHENMTSNTVEPTCTESGYTEYTCDCGYSYISDYISAKGHTYKDTVYAPTCTEPGYTEHTCSVCSYSFNSEQTAPLGHKMSSVEYAPSCAEQGYKEYICYVCEYSYVSDYIQATGHVFSENTVLPSCLEQGYTEFSCQNCDYTYKTSFTPPTGHKYEKEVLSIATCTESGEERFACACGDTYSIITSPTGHDFLRKVTMPTLSDMGYTDFTCKNCEYIYRGEYTFYSDILENAYANNIEVLAKGIDISHHNYKTDSEGNYIPLDWDAIKAAGVSYVIIRIGDAAIGIDPTFEKSYEDARAAGLDVGFYFYTRAVSVEEISIEANLVASALRGKQFEYPVYLDLEDETQKSIDSAILNEMCIEFFTILQRAGYYTGLYVNNEWLYNVIDTETALSRFEIWYARYPATADGEEPTWNVEQNGQHLGMWQYTDSGTIEGIDASVFDFSFSYKDYPALIKDGGFNGYESDVVFQDSDKSFVWVVYDGTINIRSKSDYFTNDEYDSSLDIIGFAQRGTRFEVVEKNEKYTAIKYNGQVAYISANPQYISFEGLYISN
ncbi:MAG: GH25 family lysozyme [Eubacteriales bacterium]